MSWVCPSVDPAVSQSTGLLISGIRRAVRVIALSRTNKLLSLPMPNEAQPTIPLSTVLGAMRAALGSLHDRKQIPFPSLLTETMKQLARIGHRVEAGEDYEGAWHRLRDADPLIFSLIEGYCQLLTFGYIVPWPQGNQAPSPNWFYITEKGRRWVTSDGPAPEDSDRFIAALTTLIPAVDAVIKQYFIESVVIYNRQAWFASAVMVGAASEKVIYMLLESLLSVTGGSDRRAIEKAIKERNLPNMFEQINKVLTTHRESGHLPYEVHEGCQPHLLSLFEAIRVQRNEAVHPTAGQVTPTSVSLTLSAFPSACRKAYDLIEWCQRGAQTA